MKEVIAVPDITLTKMKLQNILFTTLGTSIDGYPDGHTDRQAISDIQTRFSSQLIGMSLKN